MRLIDDDKQTLTCSFCLRPRSVGVATPKGNTPAAICSTCVGHATGLLLNTRRRDAAAARYTAADAQLQAVRIERDRLAAECEELRAELGRADSDTRPIDVSDPP